MIGGVPPLVGVNTIGPRPGPAGIGAETAVPPSRDDSVASWSVMLTLARSTIFTSSATASSIVFAMCPFRYVRPPRIDFPTASSHSWITRRWISFLLYQIPQSVR